MTESPTASAVEDVYTARTRRSSALHRLALQHINGGLSRQTLAYDPYPFYAASATAQWITDVDGNRYRDFANNYTSLIHGHRHGPTELAATEILRGSQAIGVPTELEATLAAELRRRMPLLESVRFATSGSEAVGFAARVARAATGRPRALKFEGGFHGGFGDLQHDIWNPPLPAGFAGPSRPSSGGLEPTSTLTAVYNDIASVEAAFARWGDEIAVVILEPFLGNCALIDALPAFARATAEIAHRHGALVLLDEVQGVRVSPRGAHESLGVRPDLIALGKIIGGGQPIAAFGGRREYMEIFDEGGVTQTGTFTATPLALAAGLAALSDFGDADYERLSSLGDEVRSGLREAFAAAGVPVAITGRASMFHISLTRGPMASYRDFQALDMAPWLTLRLALLNRGIFLMKRGTGCLSTPMGREDIDALVDAVVDALP